ncbi:YjjG family noncanonical pyrimidine nucleotidase [Urechidicola croceus]|uniref:Noncanonical pyrimidine nucleotidase, YjjG family n=1 Tax=Urechidicola croceus TaxID=1850246 RepID=A0A1D8PB30_9FLAO|nr:YjjG family noncanonical pyrimidine nucleotidase [Urechidicola croceus]AOW21779.1 noncanonical pyrimidine nucleotidase, YjjG family [Urechidicola croceus]
MIIKHVFFDLDHTLWDFETNSAKTFEKIFKKNNINIKVDVFLNYYRAINLTYWRLYRSDNISKEKLRYGRLKDTFDRLSYEITDNMIHTLSDEYIQVLPSFNHVFDGTFDILEYLKPKYQLHIITNGFSEVQQEKLSGSKIAKYFDKVITSESVDVKKPNPKIFQHALDISGANKTQSIMIGDSWEADFIGAKNFGMKAIFCNFDNEPVDESIMSVSNLLELKKYL